MQNPSWYSAFDHDIDLANENRAELVQRAVGSESGVVYIAGMHLVYPSIGLVTQSPYEDDESGYIWTVISS